jgi:hypothetical protein
MEQPRCGQLDESTPSRALGQCEEVFTCPTTVASQCLLQVTYRAASRPLQSAWGEHP